MNSKGIIATNNKFNDSILRQAKLDRISLFQSAQQANNLLNTLNNSPYQQTILLKPTCYILQSLHPIFDLLNRFDLVIAHDFKTQKSSGSEAVPASFPFFSDAIIGINKDENTTNFLKNWQKKIEQGTDAKNALRECLWESDIKYYVLPPEWNIQQEEYLKLWTLQEAQPAILNTSNAKLYYQQWKRKLPFKENVRYQWRKCKDIFWQVNNL